MEHVESVTQASGWEAVYVDRESQELHTETVTLWAVCTDPDDQDGDLPLVHGMTAYPDGEVSLCNEFSNFVGYKEAHQPLEEFPDWAVQDALSLMRNKTKEAKPQ